MATVLSETMDLTMEYDVLQHLPVVYRLYALILDVVKELSVGCNMVYYGLLTLLDLVDAAVADVWHVLGVQTSGFTNCVSKYPG